MGELDIRWESFEYHTVNKSEAFEDMCRRLFYVEFLGNKGLVHVNHNTPGIEVLPVKKDGFDNRTERRISFQAKYTKDINSAYQKFKESAIQTVKYYKDQIDRIYLFSNQTITTTSNQYKKIVDVFKEAGIEEVIPISNAELLDLITRHPEIAKYYFVEIACRIIPNKGMGRADEKKFSKTFRKLSEGLWVNWRSGYLANNMTKVGTEETLDYYKCINYSEIDTVPIAITPAQLRLLSILVQGEGAVVCWDELYHRGLLMQEEMDALSQGRIVRMRVLESDGVIDTVKNAIEELCSKVPDLSKIIRLAGNGKGYRICLSDTGTRSVGGSFPEENGTQTAISEWRTLKNSIKEDEDYTDTESWLRRHYAETCLSFEGGVSNAAINSKTDSLIFGDYKMAEAYINAYAQENGAKESKPEAMLDYVEKWYHGYQADNNSRRKNREFRIEKKSDYQYGKVLVLHGHPGDGKTTFCKKAVYAHCFEGWLKEAPHILRISLNPNDNGKILSRGKLNLPTSLCICNKIWNKYFCCDPLVLGKGTLIIFDGYDELYGSLEGDENASTFLGFVQCVKKYAEDLQWNVIITSRTMCVERELKEKFANVDCVVASFAPITVDQQDLVIDRMIELDDVQKMSAGKDRRHSFQYQKMDLDDYRTRVLPELRKKKRINALLQIPILFRMIVTRRFEDTDETETKAELYSKLFYSLMEYKFKKPEQIIELLGEYEKIAIRIFNYNRDTCPYGEKYNDANKELVYLFLTKSGKSKEGQLGFLHGAFNAFFLARYIVSGIQTAKEGRENSDFLRFLLTLRAWRIETPEVWQLVTEIVEMKGMKAQDPFLEDIVTLHDIESARSCMDDETLIAACLTEGEEYITGPDSETKGLKASENAVFNILCALTAVEMGCRRTMETFEGATITTNMAESNLFDVAGMQHEKKEYEIPSKYGRYSDYRNICKILCRGDYANIYLEKMNFSECRLLRVSFKRANMRESCFVAANLCEADFSEADLSGACFEKANLSKVCFSKSNLKDAIFTNANVEKADFSKSYLYNAKFWGADLTESDFREADLEQVSFGGTDTPKNNYTEIEHETINYQIREKTKLIRAKLRGAKLKGVNLEDVDLYEADLKDADLTGAVLKGANLMGADLRKACLKNADLDGIHLEKAILEGANLQGASLVGAHLDDSHLEGAVLVGTNLKNACFNGSFMRAALLIGLMPNTSQVDKGADPTDTIMDGASFRGADLTSAFMSENQYRYVRENGALGLPLSLHSGKIVLSKKESNNLIGLVKGRTKKTILTIVDNRMPFGTYFQATDMEKSPLWWRVIHRDYNKILLITEKLIECKGYHSDCSDVTWEICEVRKFLNEKFFYEAFNEMERSRITLVCNQNPDNKRWFSKGGSPTWDRVFLLSLDEAERYFNDEEGRTSTTTYYSENQYERSHFRYEEPGWWWLRTSGSIGYCASCVSPKGSILDYGFHVDNDSVFVRPALWLRS